jgi:ribosomal protein L25 (general stress protein Ctc)
MVKAPTRAEDCEQVGFEISLLFIMINSVHFHPLIFDIIFVCFQPEGKVPGVLYGSDWPKTTANAPKVSIQMSSKDIKKNLRLLSMALGNTLFELDVDGQAKQLAVVKQLQICPGRLIVYFSAYYTQPRLMSNVSQFSFIHIAVTDEPLCLNFLRYKPGTKIRIPVVYINDDASVDIKRGAYVVHINR